MQFCAFKSIFKKSLPLLICLFFSSNAFSENNLTRAADWLVKKAPKLSEKVAQLATKAADCAAKSQDISVKKLAIIDYSLSSSEKRFWLFDLNKKKLILEDLVAHGKNSGEDKATSFSNELGSLQSSIGIFQVSERYFGKHGNSLRLIGLEPGINDLALDRAIVIHGADYVSTDFIKQHKRLGRSYGCPALAPDSADKVIQHFEEGQGLLFSYYPDHSWLKKSNFLNGCSL